MFHSQLKQGLCLNRLLGFALLYSGVLAYLASNPPEGLRLFAFVAYGVLILGSLLANEMTLRLLKRHPKTEFLFLEKLGVLSASIALGVTLLGYLLIHQLEIFLLGGICILQAQYFGQRQLSRLLFGVYVVLSAMTIPFYSDLFYQNPWPGFTVLRLLPVFWVTYHFGTLVMQSVRSSSSQMSRLQSLAATDGLTGLVNRRQFNHQLNAEISRAKRNKQPLSLALFDIDNFKKLNDVYGHQVGDRVLNELGLILAKNIRESDIPARYGGEEFALILPETRLMEAHEILERIRKLVAQHVFCLPDNPITLTISIGIAQMDPVAMSAFELVEKSDAALYEAKRQGKNRVVYGVVSPPKLNFPELKPLSS